MPPRVRWTGQAYFQERWAGIIAASSVSKESAPLDSEKESSQCDNEIHREQLESLEPIAAPVGDDQRND